MRTRAPHDADERQLHDIGLIRAADGSLRLAEDPLRPAGPGRVGHPRAASEALARL